VTPTSRLRATGLSEDAQARLKRRELITQLLSQDKYKPVPLEGQIIYLFALNLGMLDTLPYDGIKKFKNEIYRFVKSKNSGLVESISTSHALTEENQDELGKVLLEYFEQAVEE